jgi:hypothetical protein
MKLNRDATAKDEESTKRRYVRFSEMFAVHYVICLIDSVIMELSPIEKRPRKNFTTNGKKTISIVICVSMPKNTV